MRISTVLSTAALTLGLAVMIPSTILGSSRSAARDWSCTITCPDSTHCYISSGDGPCHCWCDAVWGAEAWCVCEQHT